MNKYNKNLTRIAFSAIIIIGLFSTTGCVTSTHEEGERVDLGWGLLTYENDYSYKALASSDPLAMEHFRGTGYIAEDALGVDYSVEGTKIKILWGLFTVKQD
jgi:hypothetical protein